MKQQAEKKKKIKSLLDGYYNTIACGICKHNNTKVCNYCNNDRTSRIMWNMEDNYQKQLINEIYSIFNEK